MESNNNDISLANDVLINILLRLPAKSLGRCKCVCKTWYNLIREPNIINNHLHHPKNPIRLFALFGRESRSSDSFIHDYVFALFTDESLSLRKDIDNPIISHGRLDWTITNVLGPVNGLYCIQYFYHNYALMALWNPSTSEFRELPLPPFQIPPNCHDQGEYIGFGSTDEDVKLVRIHTYFRDDDDFDSQDAVIALYSLAHDCWKEIECDSVNFPYIAEGVFYDHNMFTQFNGSYYWLLNIDRDILFLFDMIREVFREVNLPPQHPRTCMETILLRDNNSIVLFANQYSSSEHVVLESVHLWEMKEEGQWFKLLSFDPSSTYVSLKASPCGFWKKDDIIIKTSGHKVVLYNINSHETRDLEMDGAAELFVLNYKESLTSVRGASA